MAYLASNFMVCVLIALTLTTAGCTCTPYSPPPMAFSGDSSTAHKTVVVPTLDTPAPGGRNVIWCATFQLCWDALIPVVGPINVPGSQDTVRRLSKSPINPGDMPEGGYYATAGRIKEGIVEKIQSEMAQRFPNVKPNLPASRRYA